MIIAQLTDAHVQAAGQPPSEHGDTNADLAAAVAAVNRAALRPDLVLFTGDLVDDGSEAAYRTFRSIADRLDMPYRLMTGNHDRADALRAVFPDHGYLGESGPVQYAFDAGPLRVVALDTTLPGRPDGALDGDRLAWLDAQLAEAAARPVMLAMHHPPIPSGLWFMDRIRLKGADALARMLARHPPPARIVCGHLHRTAHATWNGTTVSVSPSTSYQMHLDAAEAGTPRTIAEPPGFLYHAWVEGMLVTHAGPIGNHGAPKDIFPDWPEARRQWTDKGWFADEAPLTIR